MRWRLDEFENLIIKVIIVMLLGFGVGFLMNHIWIKAIEALSIGVLLLLIYLLGNKIDDFMKDDEVQ
ncbi:hypothetical protein NLX71_25980 [Paenibacillus sp. MZ04-78.2]|uniref:hypothetical protein n=1 Tax=Paenibacillus sp. MZ04-78.2 TaxID=2962034 RepID=UPI0020B80A16|nr:hypothetical protein [Paenibacillus sp. MZ04-78.2]MCP3776692.1 hypothetical protein [Paenibacillus sp. MZ04-78.2]